MFRIRRVFDDLLPIDQRVIAQVQDILRDRFPHAPARDVDGLPRKLRNPFQQRFRSMLLVADDVQGNVRGFALVLHDPELRFWFLDYIANRRHSVGSGVGGALYQAVREEATTAGVLGLFFECAPDDPEDVSSKDVLRHNVARFRFYEHFGARPIIDNAYRLPIHAQQRELPYLMYDDLDRGRPLRRADAKAITQAILEGKYGHMVTPEYVRTVVDSFVDDPVHIREFRYVREDTPPPRPESRVAPRIALVVNERHDIHHIRERGYVESPVRIAAILRQIEPTGLFRRIEPRPYAERHIREVHDGAFVDYLRRACQAVPPGKSVYPYVFPIRNQTRPPRELSIRAGYYCMDTFTPLNRNVLPAAKGAVDCALTAADEILRGERLAYALVRPPGHHAEHRAFGGFCYFNNAAVAAHYFSRHGKVALLDIDYHHGNGQERIFYERSDVLTLSIHGHPRFAYPYFSGFDDEKGAGPGEGYNVNYPLPEQVTTTQYQDVLRQALRRVKAFDARFLVVALGFDTAKGDPTGSWALGTRDFLENGRLIGALALPTLVVQEGGYRTRTLGLNARYFFQGLAEAIYTLSTTPLAPRNHNRPAPGPQP
jgi:acetoin utilization deacetylase AcuC-like enzyme/GNAT superfamily N-acetyltransferase